MLTALGTSAMAQTWTALNHQPSIGAGNELLLTDGRVLVQDADNKDWWTLTPDINGSYINGTWTQVASTSWGPLYFASQVLIDGRVYVQGGEYNLGSAVWSTEGAVYDPVQNKWTTINPPSGWTQMGDCGSITLPSGNVMVQDAVNSNIALLNVPGLTWTSPYTSGKADGNDEEGWTLLPNGNVLTVDTKNGTNSEILNTSTGVWSSAGNLPVVVVDSGSEEIGPAVLRYDGTVIQFGATAHNAIYDTNTGTWSAGPDFPKNGSGAQLDCADAPACLLPNGNVLVATSPGVYNSGTVFFEWNGTQFNSAPSTPNASGDPSYVNTMLMLPTGQVLLSDFSSNVQVYTPTGSANSAWAPTISSSPSTITAGSNYSISGTQFNGLSGCSAYGDDEQNETNYPLVRVVNNSTGHVFYCKTYNPSTMAICTGTATVSTNFLVPGSIETGASTIYVVCNGIASAGVAVTVTGSTGNPAITKISPASTTQTSSVTLTVTGSNFVNGATVDWNGAALATTFVSSTQLTAKVTSTQTANVGTYAITVVDPSGASSNSVNFAVNYVSPTLSSVSPTTVAVGSGNTKITLSGFGFISVSSVLVNGTAVSTTYVNSKTLTAVVPASYFASAGTLSVQVKNPTPGGGTTAAKTITVK
jgi:hypothetical protein